MKLLLKVSHFHSLVSLNSLSECQAVYDGKQNGGETLCMSGIGPHYTLQKTIIGSPGDGGQGNCGSASVTHHESNLNQQSVGHIYPNPYDVTKLSVASGNHHVINGNGMMETLKGQHTTPLKSVSVSLHFVTSKCFKVHFSFKAFTHAFTLTVGWFRINVRNGQKIRKKSAWRPYLPISMYHKSFNWPCDDNLRGMWIGFLLESKFTSSHNYGWQ